MHRWLLAVILLAACDEPFRPYLPAAVRIAPDSVTLAWGATFQLRATVTDSAGNDISDRFVIWRSSNPAVAAVSAHGLVTAMEGGRATITAAAGSASGTATFEVVIPVARVTFGYPDQTVLLGASVSLAATPRDSLGRPLAGRVLTWTSSDSSVAAVDGAGVVTGRGAGAATISATSEGHSADASVRVETVTFVAVTAAESDHSCGLASDGRAFCWGNNILGELGNGSPAGSRTPIEVGGGLQFASLAGGGWFTCGLEADGEGLCWGSGARGRLGSGTIENFPTPHLVAGDLRFSALHAGWAHACGATADGTYCWGSGTAVSGDAGKYAVAPEAIDGDIGFTTIEVGGDFSCGLVANGGAAWCWGVNYSGQLGNGDTHLSPSPVAVAGGAPGYAALGLGAKHACALTPLGDAWCWGGNEAGELGDGSHVSSLEPVPVSGGLAFAAITAGGDFTCGLTGDGTAYCWGAGQRGQLGTAPSEDCTGIACTPAPQVVSGGLKFSSLSAGGAHVCGLATDGVAYCWGANQSGQLGDGTTVNRFTPVRVVGQR